MLQNRWTLAPIMLVVCCLIAAGSYGLKGCKVKKRYGKKVRLIMVAASFLLIGYLLAADSILGIIQWLIDADLMVDALSELLLPPVVVIAAAGLYAGMVYLAMLLVEQWSRRHAQRRKVAQITTCSHRQAFRALLECGCPQSDCPLAYNDAEKLIYNLDAVREAMGGQTDTVYLGRNGKISTQKTDGSLKAQAFTIPVKRVWLHRPKSQKAKNA